MIFNNFCLKYGFAASFALISFAAGASAAPSCVAELAQAWPAKYFAETGLAGLEIDSIALKEKAAASCHFTKAGAVYEIVDNFESGTGISQVVTDANCAIVESCLIYSE